MTSIARTFAVSLGIVATTIFLTLLGIVVWRYHKDARDASCQAAAVILNRAIVVDGRTLTIRPTSALEELKSDSPKLWYVVSYGDRVDEFGPERRPALPFAFPYTGPAGFSAFKTPDRSRTFCLAAVRREQVQLTMMIGDPQPGFGKEVATFISRNVFPFAAACAGLRDNRCDRRHAGGPLRFTQHRTRDATGARNRSGGAARLDIVCAVPRELKPLVEALNSRLRRDRRLYQDASAASSATPPTSCARR
jgi:hypothetical protein